MISSSTKVYFATMVTTVQKLSTRLSFFRTQTFTTTHDHIVAWTSLGSAVSALREQVKIPASVLSVSAITLYLAGISALHVTTASLFTVQTFQQNVSTSVASTLALQDLCSPSFFEYVHPCLIPIFSSNPSWTPTSRSNSIEQFVCAPTTSFDKQSLLLSAFETFSGFQGLIGNTVYDVIDFNNATGNVEVNATTWTVDCGTVPQAKWATECNGEPTIAPANINNATGIWCIEIDLDEENGLSGEIILMNPYICEYACLFVRTKRWHFIPGP